MRLIRFISFVLVTCLFGKANCFDSSSSSEEENNSELEGYICSFCKGIPMYTEIILNRYSGLTTNNQAENGSDVIEQLITVEDMCRLLFSYVYDYVGRRKMLMHDDQTEASFIVATERSLDELFAALKRFKDDMIAMEVADDSRVNSRLNVVAAHQPEILIALEKLSVTCNVIISDIVRNTSPFNGGV